MQIPWENLKIRQQCKRTGNNNEELIKTPIPDDDKPLITLSIVNEISATVCPVLSGAIEDSIEDELQRKTSEINKLNEEFNKLQDEQRLIREIDNQPVIEINVTNKKSKNKLCELVKSGSVRLINDSEDPQLKEEFKKFSFEFNRKTKSKEGKLPKRLRNGW